MSGSRGNSMNEMYNILFVLEVVTRQIILRGYSKQA